MSKHPLLIGNETLAARQGGLNRYFADLTTALVKGGCQPIIAIIGSSGRGAGVSSPQASLLARLLAIRRAASRAVPRVGVVDAHFALYAVVPMYASRLRRLPLVVHFQGPWADESAVGRGDRRVVVAAKRTIELAVYRRARVVVVLSDAFRHLVVDRYGVDPARVVVVPPGVDLDRFRTGERAAARAAAGVGADAWVAVCVRRLDARMGIDVLIEAWAKVQAERPDAVLLIAGEGRERERLEALRTGLANPDGVRLLGRVSDDELVRLYQAADVSVVPTRALEGFGLVTLESMACGTPPIVTDVGGLPDGVVGLDPSLIVPGSDAGALAARILEAADGRVPSRAACRAHAERFSWDEVAKRHIEIYRRAMGERPMRVAYLGHTAALSGGELALTRMLPALEGVEAHVILGEDGPLVGRLREGGAEVELLVMPERSRRLRKDAVSPRRLPILPAIEAAGYTIRLARRLRRLRPDLVHTNTLKAALYGGIAGRLAGVPVVWHVRDRIAPDYLPAPAVRLVRWAGRVLPRAVIANSEATLATLGRPADGSSRVYDAVVVPSSVARGRRRPFVQSDLRPFTVGMVGRLAPWKGQDLFLRAFASAFPEGDVRARIVGSAMFGEDDWAPSLENLAASLGISERVDMVGFVDDMDAEYGRIDVLVHASTIPEPFGQVVVEGMAAGVPVVAADAGGPAEVVTDEVDGLLYRMGDAAALAERLVRLAGDRGLRARLAEGGRRRSADFSPERVAEQVMGVYRKVLAGDRSGS